MDTQTAALGGSQESNVPLPLEIVLLIADVSDFQTLKSFSTTCRVIHKHTRRRLFNSVTVKLIPEDLSRASVDFAIGSIGPHIKQLTFDSAAEENLETERRYELSGTRGHNFDPPENPSLWNPALIEMRDWAQTIVQNCAENLESLEFRCIRTNQYVNTQIDFNIFHHLFSNTDLISIKNLFIDASAIYIEHDCAWYFLRADYKLSQNFQKNVARLWKFQVTTHEEMWYPIERILGTIISKDSIFRQINILNWGDYYTTPDESRLRNLTTLTSLTFRGVEFFTERKLSLVIKNNLSLTELDMQFCCLTNFNPDIEDESYDTWAKIFQACLELSRLKVLRLHCLHNGEGDRDWVDLKITSGTPADHEALANLYEFAAESKVICPTPIETILDIGACGRALKNHPDQERPLQFPNPAPPTQG